MENKKQAKHGAYSSTRMVRKVPRDNREFAVDLLAKFNGINIRSRMLLLARLIYR